MCTRLDIDPDRAESFAEALLDTLNSGALALMVSLGHRSGLFDTMASMTPADSAAIAEAAGLNERYVREWLGAMVVGRVVVRDPEAATYHLPAEHAACLIRTAAADNMAVFAQYIGLLGTVEDAVLERFRHGGGVPYEAFGRFQEVMAEDSGQTVVPRILDTILPLAPGVVERLEQGIDVLDIGCGRGRALEVMARAYPASRFRGIDLSSEAIGEAGCRAEQAGLDNLVLEVDDVAETLGEDAYDLVTAFDVIHDQRAPARVLANVHRALKPDGVFLMQDIAGSRHPENNLDHPLAPLLYTISTMHCMTVSLAQGGAGLGTMWGEETAEEMLAEAGFGDLAKHRLDHDIQNCYYVARSVVGRRASQAA